jgi:hypothetical protein
MLTKARKLEMLDFTVGKLREQGKRAIDRGVCLYRAPDGSKCAAGHWIPDTLYTSAMEGFPLDRSITAEALLKSGLSKDEIEFLIDLQDIHDGATIGFEYMMADYAKLRKGIEAP